MKKDKNSDKPNAVDKYDKSHKQLNDGEAPNNPATNKNIPFEEGQWETENELPQHKEHEEEK